MIELLKLLFYTVKNNTSIIQDFYYLFGILGTIVLIVAVIVAWGQLNFAKENAKLRIKREEATLSILAIKEFFSKLEKDFYDFRDMLTSYNIKKYTGAPVFNKEELKQEAKEFIKKIDDRTDTELNKSMAELISSLETFSIPFIHKLADIEIAFLSIGLQYCNVVKKISPIIAFIRDKQNDIRLLHIVVLYKIFAEKLKERDINTFGKY